jgi:tellurite resistance protein
MIFIGTMNWASTRLRGMFVCPHCGGTQPFRLRASRPFLTVYFIPLLPIGGLQEFVQCATCKNSFETEILTTRMTSSRLESSASTSESNKTATFEEDLLKIIALIMVDDGHVTEEEIRLARRMYENMTEVKLSREELGHMCSLVQLQRLTTESFLATASQRRGHEEKLLMLQAAFGVAGADGDVSPKRMGSLLRMQQSLELEEYEFQRAIEATEQWLT